MKTVRLTKYPNVRLNRDYTEVENFLIALYLAKSNNWRLVDSMRQTHYYTIEPLECFYTLEENQGVLCVGRDNYIITAL